MTVRWPSIRFVVVAILSAAVLSFNFGARGLLSNDDTRFPMLARDILVHRHWLVPALPDGTPHLVKPPMMAWLIALASWPTGTVSVRTAVLPSMLSALGVVLLTYGIGRRLFNVDAGVVASLTAATTLGIYGLAHSAMPDMVQLLGVTAAMAAYVAAEFGHRGASLVAFYACIGVASLSKGAAGFLPLAIGLVDTVREHGLVGLRRLVSRPGLTVLVLLAAPWWIVAAMVGQHDRFVEGVVVNDQLRWYFGRQGWGWRAVTEPIGHALAITLPWCVLLPFAFRQTAREADPERARRVRLLLVWLATVFAIMAVSGQQRERYYLPLCPAVALLIGWWYTTLRWRRPAPAFAAAWMAVVAGGLIVVPRDTRRYNATTEVAALRTVVAHAPARVYAHDVPELVLSFNLDRPVLINGPYRVFEERVRQGEAGYLVISDRALSTQTPDPCVRRVATGLATRREFTVLDSQGCGERRAAAGTQPPG